ncbi:DUF3226 domain-containing protein [Crenothrix sp.]|uniref:DUF3226 domain-containing protein n=1 Tax=Crenothrix sp. TaxID=3100433 RepID=UPI00374DA895
MVKIAIVCEGKDDKVFFETLIKHLGFDERRVSFYIFNGKSNLFKADNKKYEDLKLVVASGQIDKVLFVLDADNVQNDATYGGFDNTQLALDAIIKQLAFEDISQTYIMCDPISKVGYLESFILSTIPEEQRNCIEHFLECSQFKSKGNHKAILNKIYNIAYPNAPYDFEHSYFDSLKLKLINLFKQL